MTSSTGRRSSKPGRPSIETFPPFAARSVCASDAESVTLRPFGRSSTTVIARSARTRCRSRASASPLRVESPMRTSKPAPPGILSGRSSGIFASAKGSFFGGAGRAAGRPSSGGFGGSGSGASRSATPRSSLLASASVSGA